MNEFLGNRRAIATLVGPALLIYTAVMLVPVFWSAGYSLTAGNAITGYHFIGLANFRHLLSDPNVRHGPVVHGPVRGRADRRPGARRLPAGAVLRLRPQAGVRADPHPHLLPGRPAHRGGRAHVPEPLRDRPGQRPGQLAAQRRRLSLGRLVRLARATPSGSSSSWTSGGPWASTRCSCTPAWSTSRKRRSRRPGSTARPGCGSSGTSCCRCPSRCCCPSLIFSINGTLKVFDSILALTNGGPGNATTPLTLYMFNTSFSYGEYGYGATIALLLTVICLVVTARAVPRGRAPATPGGGVTAWRRQSPGPHRQHGRAHRGPKAPAARSRRAAGACRAGC